MTKRLRHLFAGLAAAAAVAVTIVGVPAPASADPGVSCTAPSISGTVAPGFGSTSNRVYISAKGSVSSNCVNPFTDYKYELSYYLASPFSNATSNSSSADVQSTSLSKTGTGASPSTSIAFPTASVTPNATFGYHGVYVAISSWSKSSFQQTWSTDPANVDWYFLPGYGSYNTASMEQDAPSNYCQPLGFSKGGC